MYCSEHFYLPYHLLSPPSFLSLSPPSSLFYLPLKWSCTIYGTYPPFPLHRMPYSGGKYNHSWFCTQILVSDNWDKGRIFQCNDASVLVMYHQYGHHSQPPYHFPVCTWIALLTRYRKIYLLRPVIDVSYSRYPWCLELQSSKRKQQLMKVGM